MAPDGLTGLHIHLHAVEATSVSLLGLQAQFKLAVDDSAAEQNTP